MQQGYSLFPGYATRETIKSRRISGRNRSLPSLSGMEKPMPLGLYNEAFSKKENASPVSGKESPYRCFGRHKRRRPHDKRNYLAYSGDLSGYPGTTRQIVPAADVKRVILIGVQ
ncbi:MAG: hypothetical protein LBB80_05870 [Treponema sp.]|jgi:hypothetical protein|nr:hypothetical protein [Treponema sp.]